MEGLMHLCRNWGDADCHAEVSKFKYDKRVETKDEMHLWPPLDVQRGLDEVCKKCNFRYFNVTKKECPLCDGSDLTETRGGQVVYESGREIEVFFLKCNQCGTDLRFTQ